MHACSAETLRRRFFVPGPVGPDEVLARYHRYLLVPTIARDGGRPVGLLNLVVVASGVVEASLLVADARQRQGTATFVLAEVARPRWAGWTVHATVQPENAAAGGLLRRQRLGRSRLVAVGPGELEYAIALPAR